MIFEYNPELTGTHESLWMFEIPSFKIKQPFLIVGKVLEPKVFFEVGKVDFGPLLLGGKNKETIKLKNLDHLPYTFNFSKASIKGDNEYGDSLVVNPLHGIVQGDNEVKIEVVFKPKVEGEYNYNLVCNVTQKPGPLTLNVKGIGYMLHHSVHLSSQPAALIPSEIYHIDFGDIFINEKKTRSITISNDGDFNFDYVIKKNPISYVTISPETSTVKTASKVEIELSFNPLTEFQLKSNQHTFVLNIVSGPTYHFKLTGSARKPGVELSFLHYDFGPCFVMKTPMPRQANLLMKNLDNSAMSIETYFDKTNYLDVKLASGQVLLPKEPNNPNINVLSIPIIFVPREIKNYEEIISFDINALHKIDVKIVGEGIPLKLELERAEDNFVDFGTQRVGADVTKVVS